MKKVIVALVVIAMVVMGTVSLVGCEKSLDGAYIDKDLSWQLVIKENKIALYHNSELQEEGTFTRNGDVITTTLTFSKYFKDITVTKEGNLTHPDKMGEKDITTTYTKVKK